MLTLRIYYLWTIALVILYLTGHLIWFLSRHLKGLNKMTNILFEQLCLTWRFFNFQNSVFLLMEVLTLLLLQDFINQFVFIWGHEYCSMTLGQFTIGIYYCFKNWSCVYFACQRLPYGKEDQTLFIDDEPNKAFQNSKSSGFFFGVF